MAKLRKNVSYKNLERPYTRTSKYTKFQFVRAVPHRTIARHQIGDEKKNYTYRVSLISRDSFQLRQNAIESARMTAVRALEAGTGQNNFFLKLRVYPFHILRENPLASGAGADRMSTGMQKAFGKPISVAAQIRKGQVIFSADVFKNGVPAAKKAFKRASSKLPCTCTIEIIEKTTEPVKEKKAVAKKKETEPVVVEKKEIEEVKPVEKEPAVVEDKPETKVSGELETSSQTKPTAVNA